MQAMANIRVTRELGIATGQNSKGDRCLWRCWCSATDADLVYINDNRDAQAVQGAGYDEAVNTLKYKFKHSRGWVGYLPLVASTID